MRPHVFALAIFLGFFCVSCSDSPNLTPPDDEEEPWTYPVILHPYDQDVLTERLARFHAENPGACAGIDQFGGLRNAGICQTPDGVGVGDSVEAVAVASEFLEQNREFLFLTAELPPVVWVSKFGAQHWRVRFGSQVVDYLTVYETPIELTLARSVYRVVGRHYPEYRVPAEPAITAAEAQTAIPWMIRFRCFTMIDAFLRDDSVLLAFPFLTGSGDPIEGGTPRLELRIAYRFTYEDTRGEAIQYTFVDAMTGEKLADRPLILCRGSD